MSKPNILFILADEHRADCLGAYGNKEIQTSALDQLANDGTRYDSCFCAFPVCTPSRYSILTGLYPHQHNAWTNRCTIGAGVATFPQVLKQAGYHTACVGKMHFTPTYLDVGFEEMLLSEQDGQGRMEDDYHEELMNAGCMDYHDVMDQRSEYRQYAPKEYWENFGSGPSDVPEELHSTSWTGRNAVEQLKKWKPEGGNFLMAGFIKPHHPFDPPARWLEMYDESALSLLPGWADTLPEQDAKKHVPYFPNENMNASVMRRITACYYACISHMDYWVEQMIQTLKARGMYENTLIIYTADHGDYMGFHHMVLKQNHMYDPVVRVPLLIKLPFEQHPGQVIGKPVSSTDIASSILKWSGLDSDLVEGTPIDETDRKWVISEQIMNGNWEYMVRGGRYKAFFSPNETVLFDLKRDPGELINIAEHYPEIISEAHNVLFNWLAFSRPRHVHLDENASQVKNEIQKGRDPEAVSAYYKKTFNYENP